MDKINIGQRSKGRNEIAPILYYGDSDCPMCRETMIRVLKK